MADNTLFYEQCREPCKRFECDPQTHQDIEYFYLDTKGYFTIGRGHCVSKAKEPGDAELRILLPYFYRSDGVRCSGVDELKTECKAVHNAALGPRPKGYNHYASYYKPYTKLRFKGSEQIWRSDVDLILSYLNRECSYFRAATTPFEMKLVLLDVAFNSGPGHLADNPSKKLLRIEGKSIHFASVRVAIRTKDIIGLQKAIENLGHALGVPDSRARWREQQLDVAVRKMGLISPTNPLPSARGADVIQPTTSKHQTNHRHNHKQPISHAASAPHATMQSPYPLGLHDPQQCLLPTQPHEAIVDDSYIGGEQPSLLNITTPFSRDPSAQQFVITGLFGKEELSNPFCYIATTYSRNTQVSGQDLLGKSVTITINQSDDETGKTTPRYINGIVHRIVGATPRDGWRQYTLEIVPTLYLLGWSADVCSFQHKSVIDIVKELAQNFSFRVDVSRIQSPSPERDYCVQYSESALNFIHRLLESEGIFYYFIHKADSHVMTLGDSALAYQSNDKPHYQVNNREWHYPLLDEWLNKSTAHHNKVTIKDYDFTQPDTNLQAEKTAAKSTAAIKNSEQFLFPGVFKTSAEGQRFAKIKLEAEQAWSQVITAFGGTSQLQPGQIFTLADHDDKQQVGDYVVSSVWHYAQDNASVQHADDNGSYYHNRFDALPANVVARPKAITLKPIASVQSVKVVGDGQSNQALFVDRYGRACIQFPWMRSSERTSWVRVAQRWAGNQYGMIFHPRLGHEVLVDFEHGDPDRPIIAGSLYNASNMPPYALPTNMNRSGIKTQSLTGSKDDYNELYFDDKKDQEIVNWRANHDFTQVTEKDDTTTVVTGNHHTQILQGSSIWRAEKRIVFNVGTAKLEITPDGISINGQLIELSQHKTPAPN